ncbi:hypothetical protein WISP_36340 [Willisornis vidua]|uniref:Uncharacterized protein n=1 Tax=Willisornis vidua TaxID=1566151 RepID=A0ABQ9DNP2_9PASS|nr:hypothetical protein WISP_36340 [Willisornis vidua]
MHSPQLAPDGIHKFPKKTKEKDCSEDILSGIHTQDKTRYHYSKSNRSPRNLGEAPKKACDAEDDDGTELHLCICEDVFTFALDNGIVEDETLRNSEFAKAINS